MAKIISITNIRRSFRYLTEDCPADDPGIRADVASFLSVYNEQDVKFSGRAIARYESVVEIVKRDVDL